MTSSLPDQHGLLQIQGTGKRSLEKKAYQEIRQRIVNADYLPGMLLSENELADQLNMSRTPIRAAISLLETEGFVESSKGRGVFVKEISFQEFREMFEVLQSMLLFALELAARRGVAIDLTTLRGHVESQERAAEAGDNRAYYESYLSFVETILSAVHNRHMLQIVEQIKGKYIFKVVSYRKQNAHNAPKPNQAKRASMQIYDALERRDFEEAKAAILEINELVFQQLKSFDF